MASSRGVLRLWWLPLLAVLLASCAKTTEDPAAVQQISDVLMRQFDRPDARLSVQPIVVVGDDAVASWAQGGRGGRALMRRGGDGWHIVLCSGDALRDAGRLAEMGVQPSAAAALVERLVAAEAKLPADRTALFSRFDGVVTMDADGSHPGQHGDGHERHGMDH